MDRFSNMPDEVNEIILSRLDMPEVTAMKKVSRYFRDLVLSPVFSRSYNELRGVMGSTWIVAHALNNMHQVGGVLYWVRVEDGRRLVMPLMPLLQPYVLPAYTINLLCVWGSIALFRRLIPDINDDTYAASLLAVNTFNRDVQVINVPDELFFNNWSYLKIVSEGENRIDYRILLVDMWDHEVPPRYLVYSSRNHVWVDHVEAIEMNPGIVQEVNISDEQTMIIDFEGFTYMVIFVNNQPVFMWNETRTMYDDAPFQFNFNPPDGWRATTALHHSRTGHGFVILMVEHELISDHLITRIMQVFLLRIHHTTFRYQLLSPIDEQLIPHYDIILDHCTLELVNNTVNLSVVFTQANQPGRRLLVFSFDVISETWSSRNIELEANNIHGPFSTAQLTLHPNHI